MICKSQENTIATLLSLRTKEDIAVDVINKIASVSNQPTNTKKIGEIAELQQLLKAYIH